MRKNIDIKERIVHMHDIDTGIHESEIIKYLDKKMRVRIHSAFFNNKNYTFIGKASEQVSSTFTISGYRKKSNNDKSAVEIK